ITSLEDCRNLFPPLTELTNLVYVGGDGQEAMPGDPLPQPLEAGVFNWRWPVPGAKVRFTPQGGGKLAADKAGLAAAAAGAPREVTRGGDGAARCAWLPEPDAKKTSQQVEARLLGADGNPLPPLLHFNANLSVAGQVAYDPAACPDLKGARTVQDAIDRLCKLERGGCAVVVGKGGAFEGLEQALKALLGQDRVDLGLCLLPGDHVLPAAVKLARPLRRLKVVGCNRASRLVVAEPVVVRGLAEFTLREATVRFITDRG